MKICPVYCARFWLAPALGVSVCDGADLIVEENGVLPNYSSIQAAVTAASPGDRIFVKNKASGIPYQEAVTINKPVELLSFASGAQFLLLGDVGITPGAANFSSQHDTVRIIGMTNQNGSINATANSTTGTPIRVEVLSCELASGSITITGSGLVSRVAGNWVKDGSILTREADIIGNLVSGDITIHDVVAPSDPAVETLHVVGNRLCTETGGFSYGSITWNNDAHYLYCANNWVRSSDIDGMIRVNAMRAGSGGNQIVNNALEADGSRTNDGIFFASQVPAGIVLLIENNALHNEGGSPTERAIRFVGVSAASTVVMSYNVHEGWTSFSNAPVDVSQTGNVQAPGTFDLDNITGACTTAACVNAGNPDAQHTDHDLTRNDCGVAGGSCHFGNFWPILTGGARVYFVKAPRVVTQSGTLTLEADAFAR